MLGLREGTVAGRVPDGEADPFLAGSIEGDTKTEIAKWRLVGGRNDIAADFLAVTPDNFDELQRKRPFNVGNDFAIGTAALDGPVFDENFARSYKKVAGA